MFGCFFELYGGHRDLHVLTHSFPTRRSSDLARSGGFVSRVYARAPGDVVRAGAPIADLLLPEWGGAQTEYLSVRRLGKPDLTAAARQRLRLMGMSDGLKIGRAHV